MSTQPRFRRDLSEFSSSYFRQISAEIFVHRSLNISIFDKWWTLESITFGVRFGSAVGQLKIEDLRDLEKTGIPQTDEWIDWIVEEKMTGRFPD